MVVDLGKGNSVRASSRIRLWRLQEKSAEVPQLWSKKAAVSLFIKV